MTTIHVDVTAEDITACPRVPDVGDGFRIDREDALDPVELAIARATGRKTICDQDAPEDEIATIGDEGGRTILVVSTAPTVAPWIERFYKGEGVEPFSFDIELEDWLVALIARNTTIDDEVLAVAAEDRRVAAGGGPVR